MWVVGGYVRDDAVTILTQCIVMSFHVISVLVVSCDVTRSLPLQNCKANTTQCVQMDCTVSDFRSLMEGQIAFSGYLDEYYVYHVSSATSLHGVWGVLAGLCSSPFSLCLSFVSLTLPSLSLTLPPFSLSLPLSMCLPPLSICV